MKAIKTSLIVVLLMVVCVVDGHSQTEGPESYKFPGETFYSKGKIYLLNNVRFEATNLKISNDQLTFTNKATSQVAEYDLDDVSVIKVSKGTHAGQYALYGGLTGALVALSIVVQVNADPYSEEDINEAAIIGSVTAAGSLIGGLIGWTQPKWETLYVSDHASLLYAPRYAFSFKANKGYFGVNFQFTY